MYKTQWPFCLSVNIAKSKSYSFAHDKKGAVTNTGSVQLPRNQAGQVTGTGGHTYVYDSSGKRVKGTKNGKHCYSIYDLTGRMIYQWDQQTETITDYIFLGKERVTEAQVSLGNGSQNVDNTNVGYTGHQWDKDTGLNYMQARYYDPLVGRFLSNDPVGFRDIHSFNRYAYANNNPYRYTDPNGQYAESLWDAASLSIGIVSLGSNLSQGNWVAAAMDTAGVIADSVALALPIVPGGAGITISGSRAATSRLPDSAIVCRGGSCTADRFASGSGVSTDSAGRLDGVSVNSAPDKSLQELTEGIPHKKVGVTTVCDVRNAGGDVVASPTKNNPNHATLSGVTAGKAEELMTPTVINPSAGGGNTGSRAQKKQEKNWGNK